jgi:hypothetical protein
MHQVFARFLRTPLGSAGASFDLHFQVTISILYDRMPPVSSLMFRADRWLSKFNDPLVNRMSEHVNTIQELVNDQEMRVKSANEVLTTMKLIAGTALHLVATPLCTNTFGAQSLPQQGAMHF